MLINVEVYERTSQTWHLTATMDVDHAYKIWSTQHHLGEVKRQLTEYGVYRTKTVFSAWEWDEDLNEDFEVVTTMTIRFRPYKNDAVEEAA